MSPYSSEKSGDFTPPIVGGFPNEEVSTPVKQESIGASLQEIIPGIKLENLKQGDVQGLYVSDGQKESQGNTLDEGYSAELYYLKEDAVFLEDLSRFLKDKPLIDLGAGRFGVAYELMQLAGISGYVACEPHFFMDLAEDIERRTQNPKILGKDEVKRPHAVVAEDMLAFLKRIPSGSVNILTSGIDSDILRKNRVGRTMNEESVILEIRDEISRVLHPQGCQISIASETVCGSNLNLYLLKKEKNDTPVNIVLFTKSEIQKNRDYRFKMLEERLTKFEKEGKRFLSVLIDLAACHYAVESNIEQSVVYLRRISEIEPLYKDCIESFILEIEKEETDLKAKEENMSLDEVRDETYISRKSERFYALGRDLAKIKEKSEKADSIPKV